MSFQFSLLPHVIQSFLLVSLRQHTPVTFRCFPPSESCECFSGTCHAEWATCANYRYQNYSRGPRARRTTTSKWRTQPFIRGVGPPKASRTDPCMSGLEAFWTANTPTLRCDAGATTIRICQANALAFTGALVLLGMPCSVGIGISVRCCIYVIRHIIKWRGCVIPDYGELSAYSSQRGSPGVTLMM